VLSQNFLEGLRKAMKDYSQDIRFQIDIKTLHRRDSPLGYMKLADVYHVTMSDLARNSVPHYYFLKFLSVKLYFRVLNSMHGSRNSSVGIALGYGLDDRVFKSRQRLGIFLFTTASRTALGPTQLPIQWLPGALSLGVKRPGREVDRSPPSSAEVKKFVELYLHSPSTPSWRSAQLKHRDNFTFTLNSVHTLLRNSDSHYLQYNIIS
jgi:hypothetical protein